MEYVTDADYANAERVCKDFEIKSLENIMICMLKLVHCFWLMYLKPLE